MVMGGTRWGRPVRCVVSLTAVGAVSDGRHNPTLLSLGAVTAGPKEPGTLYRFSSHPGRLSP
jgi:hypothetical protein